jgi:hypothetical protein
LQGKSYIRVFGSYVGPSPLVRNENEIHSPTRPAPGDPCAHARPIPAAPPRPAPAGRDTVPTTFACQYIELTKSAAWGHFAREVETPRLFVDLLHERP